MRYFVHLAYMGARYRGWQRQKQTVRTIQQVIETHFSKMLKERVTIFGCGRTDAEVHASQYFMHFDTDKDIDYDPVFRINKLLPEDIRVFEILPVHLNAHAQYDAIRRTYQYHIRFNENPFTPKTSTWVDGTLLDFEKMQEAIHIISQQSDFRSMCKKPNQYKSTHCTLSEMTLSRSDNGLMIQITANRFLQAMIRLLVGRLLDIARGDFAMDQLIECFETGNPPKLHMPARPYGLYLSKVVYPYLERENLTSYKV